MRVAGLSGEVCCGRLTFSLSPCSRISGWRRRFWVRMAESSRRSLRNWPTLLRGSAAPWHNLPSVRQKNFTNFHFSCHNVPHIINARVTQTALSYAIQTEVKGWIFFYAHNPQGFKISKSLSCFWILFCCCCCWRLIHIYLFLNKLNGTLFI